MAWLVVGYGSPVKGDDRIGQQVASACAGSGVRAIAVELLTPELAADVAEADGVVFVDARSGPDRGRVRCEPIVAHPAAASLTHALAPAALLYLTGILYGRWPEAMLITIETDAFGLGEATSDAVVRAGDRAVACVHGVLDGWRSRAAPARD